MRSLSTALQEKLFSGRVNPSFKVYTWENTHEIGTVITGTAPAGFDLTPYVVSIEWEVDSLTINLVDPVGVFHPDYGEFALKLRDGCVVRLVEGDTRVDESLWINSFTGVITGQPGWKRNRETGTLTSSFMAYSRENNQSMQNRSITSNKYTVGTDLGIMFSDICTGLLKMDQAEIRVPGLLGYYFHHKINQLVQVAPWKSLETILEVGCQIPFFDGDGRLAAYSKNVDRTPVWIMPDWASVVEDEVPEHNGDNINYVEVIYLSPETEQVDGEYQVLCTANITTGFFTFGEQIECWWSDDHRQRARDTDIVYVKSINDNLIPGIGTESYEEIDEYHGVITVSISVWVPLLATLMLAEYIALAAIPDGTTSESSNKLPTTLSVPGEGGYLMADPSSHVVSGEITIAPTKIVSTEDSGWTIPWGRIGQAQAIIVILGIMMSLGSAQYEIWGTPYDMVYLEKRVVATEDGLEYWKEKRSKIENDFICTDDRAQDIAVTELIYQHGLASPRKLKTINHPGLEIGDIIQTAWGQRFFITGLSKSMQHGEPVTLNIEGFKITSA